MGGGACKWTPFYMGNSGTKDIQGIGINWFEVNNNIMNLKFIPVWPAGIFIGRVIICGRKNLE